MTLIAEDTIQALVAEPRIVTAYQVVLANLDTIERLKASRVSWQAVANALHEASGVAVSVDQARNYYYRFRDRRLQQTDKRAPVTTCNRSQPVAPSRNQVHPAAIARNNKTIGAPEQIRGQPVVTESDGLRPAARPTESLDRRQVGASAAPTTITVSPLREPLGFLRTLPPDEL